MVIQTRLISSNCRAIKEKKKEVDFKYNQPNLTTHYFCLKSVELSVVLQTQDIYISLFTRRHRITSKYTFEEYVELRQLVKMHTTCLIMPY